MKKYLYSSLLALCAVFMASAQMKGPMNGNMNMGHVYGKVVDSTGKGISDVSVVITKNVFDTVSKKRKDVPVKAFITKANGEFNFEELSVFMPLQLKIAATGYKQHKQAISFQMKMPAGGGGMAGGQGQSGGNPMGGLNAVLNAFDKDLGNIKLTADVTQLQTVTVTTSAKPLLKMDIDKKVFNVEKNMVSSGGTAVDVMRNVPSLQVDIDGNVKLRNAAPQIYVDGRTTSLSLDQIPADAIESVEVITNPSAKYDASGGNAGILNIVLKKNKRTGYNGNLMAGVDSHGGFNGGGNLSLRQNKFNISLATMTNQMRNRTSGTTNRLNYGDTLTHVLQQNNNKTTGGFLFGRLGVDYFVTNRTTLSLAGIKVHGKFKPGETIDIQTDTLLNGGKLTGLSQRSTKGEREFNASGLQFGIKHNFPKAGEELTADLNYFSGRNEGSSLYTTQYYQGNNVSATQLQQVISNGTNQFMTIQTDYVKPFNDKTKLETGLRAQLNHLVNNNETFLQRPSSPDMVKLGAATNNYKNDNNVYAAYVSVSSKIKDFGYQLGLRAERSDYTGEITNTGEQFSNKYPISLFPSMFLSQKLKKQQELQLSITRRINRPNFFQLIPYVDYTDSLNITRGNPSLKPEFTYSSEMSYGKTFKGNNSILFSVYYKYTDHLITRYLDKSLNPVTGRQDLINTFINANSAYAAGAELTSVNSLTRFWDLTSNVNVYNSKINTANVTGNSQDALWSWFGKLNSTFKLPSNVSIQLTADYQSKTNLPVNNNTGGFGPPMQQAQSASQGYVRPFWGMDLAVKKSFLKNNAATVTLSVNDIFRTRKSDQHSESLYFTQDYYRLNNPQLVRLNFTYRFGKMDLSLFKRQNTKNQGSGMEGVNMQ